jgi:hypothetical protein
MLPAELSCAALAFDAGFRYFSFRDVAPARTIPVLVF